MDLVVSTLKRVRRRLFVQRWLHLTFISLIYTSSISCLWLVLTRFLPILGKPEPVCLGVVVAGCLVAGTLAIRRRPALVDAALAADHRVGLKERLTSSLELAHVENAMVAELHEDARRHLDQIDIRRDFAIHLPQSSRWLVLPVLLLGVCNVFLPEFDLFGMKARQAEARAKTERIQTAVQRLREEIKPLEAAVPLPESSPLEETKALVDKVSTQLERGEITEKQALAKLVDLRDALKERTNEANAGVPKPKVAASTMNPGIAKDVANDIEKGKFGEAAQKIQAMKEKLEKGELNKKEAEKAAQDLKQLAKMLGNQNAAMSEALSEMAQALEMGDPKQAAAAMAKMDLSLKDLESMLQQLDQLAKAQACLSKCKNCLSKIPCIGDWAEGETNRRGIGMGKPGKGQGGNVGDLPQINAKFDPSLLPGKMVPGKVLMSIEQKAAPETGEESTIEYTQQTFVQAQQQAEQALEQEEIPRGSREFVRQYFGTLETSGTEQGAARTGSVP